MKSLAFFGLLTLVSVNALAGDFKCGDYKIHSYVGTQLTIHISKADGQPLAIYQAIPVTASEASPDPQFADQEVVIDGPGPQRTFYIGERVAYDQNMPKDLKVTDDKAASEAAQQEQIVSIEIGHQSIACTSDN